MTADILGVSKREFLRYNQAESIIVSEKFIKGASAYVKVIKPCNDIMSFLNLNYE